MTVKIGDQFRSVYADANCLWEVKAPAGRGMWRCETMPEYTTIRGRKVEVGYAGVVQGFTTDYIERSRALDETWARLGDEHEDYYANLPVGTIVHYDNGFAQFIRCERVEGPKKKRLRPLALVGNWQDIDLPRRQADGTIWDGHYAEMVRKGQPFEPNASNIWENYDAKQREWSMRGLADTSYLNEIGLARHAKLPYQAPFDPTTAPAVSLDLPDMTDEQEKVAILARRLHTIREITGEWPREQTVEAFSAVLRKVREAL